MKITITGEHIRLGQLLKKMNMIETGGQAKTYIDNNKIKVNGKRPEGRGTKVYTGTTISINDDLYQIVNK